VGEKAQHCATDVGSVRLKAKCAVSHHHTTETALVKKAQLASPNTFKRLVEVSETCPNSGDTARPVIAAKKAPRRNVIAQEASVAVRHVLLLAERHSGKQFTLLEIAASPKKGHWNHWKRRTRRFSRLESPWHSLRLGGLRFLECTAREGCPEQIFFHCVHVCIFSNLVEDVCHFRVELPEHLRAALRNLRPVSVSRGCRHAVVCFSSKAT
jgi:hypothetical protein